MLSNSLFDIPSNWLFHSVFQPNSYPWDWLKYIPVALQLLTDNHPLQHSFYSLNEIPPNLFIKGSVYIDKSVELPPSGTIEGPCYIGPGTQLRPGIYIRGNVIVGENCVLGNSCEFKNSILLNNVQVPHFNYVGDSVLGNYSHLGAGAILSNVRLDKKLIRLNINNQLFETGLKKMGAILGDYAEVGCNAVLQPGTILDKNSIVYPCISFKGYLPHNTTSKVSNI